MKIQIAKKLILFSNKPKTSFLIPKTGIKVTLYPTRLILEDLAERKTVDFIWKNQGSISDFKCLLDLEKKKVECSFRDEDLFCRFEIFSKENKIFISLKKGKLIYRSDQLQLNATLIKNDELSLMEKHQEKKIDHIENLSLGSHKSLDLQKVVNRKDLKEILPILFRLGQVSIDISYKHICGTIHLLKELENRIEKTEMIEEGFIDLFKAGFSDFIPRLFDEEYQGYTDPKEKITESSLVLLNAGYKLIRSLFFRQNGQILELLPLKLFHHGRMFQIDCNGLGKLDFEWSKKLMKKAVFHAEKSTSIQLKLHPSIKSFRLRKNRQDTGSIFKPMQILAIEKGQNYLFDRFQK